MFDDLNLWNGLLAIALCCALPVIAFTVLALLAIRGGNQYVTNAITPDMDKLAAQYTRMQRRNPKLSHEALVHKIISRQAMRSGIIGALTSFGGIFVLPFMLTIDLYASLRVQRQMVYFIAQSFGKTQFNAVEKQAIDTLIMAGGSAAIARSDRILREVSERVARRVFVRISEKALAKIVPILGAVVGFAVNYFAAQATGRLAERYFATQVKQLNQG